MTDRLYYTDAYLTDFDATVEDVAVHDGRTAVRLDRTAFYPTSGGQPFDVGTIGGARVVDVVDADNGGVLHVVDHEVKAGERVRGQVDWRRRFDHMQQHTGQHVLSAAFEHVQQARTESFHLGEVSATIDLSRELTPEQIARAEDDANRIVWEDRPVAVTFVDAKDAARLPLRKPPAREGVLRLVGVHDYDLSACGGTHVARTGAIGIIAVAGWERFRGGTRVEFVCGGRALNRHRRLRDLTANSTRLLSVGADDLPQAIERLQSDLKDAARRLKDAQSALSVHQAQALAAEAEDGLVLAALDGWDQNGLKGIASAIVSRPGMIAALVGMPTPCAVVVARSPEVPLDSGSIVRALTARCGGKGGGRPDLAQGGGIAADPAQIVAVLRELLGRSAPL